MNITADLIKSILTQSEVITCKNIRIESECQEDIIIKFEDDTDTTISICYTPVADLFAIGTINSLGCYRNFEWFGNISIRDPDTFRKHLTVAVASLEMQHEIALVAVAAVKYATGNKLSYDDTIRLTFAAIAALVDEELEED